MRLHRSFAATIYIIFIFLSCHASSITWAESSSSAAELSLLALRATSQQSPNGFEVNSGNLNIKVSALRDDVLRVTLYRGGASPEDASWGVLPEARKSLVPVRLIQPAITLAFARKR